jgi:methionine sulfoxide reductase heme-binding subunit
MKPTSLTQRQIVIAKVVLWILLFFPLAYVLYGIYGAVTRTSDLLGANPQSEIEHITGEWTMRMLLFTLAITPLRRITGWNWLIRFRRLLGLFGFFYASIHFCVYLWFDQGFVWSSILADIAKRRFIYVGFAAWLLLVPLTITSTTGWIRRLGGKRWNLVHRLTYVCAGLGIIHFYWGQKADHEDPILYGSILAGLFAIRIFYNFRKNTTKKPKGPFIPTAEQVGV